MLAIILIFHVISPNVQKGPPEVKYMDYSSKSSEVLDCKMNNIDFNN